MSRSSAVVRILNGQLAGTEKVLPDSGQVTLGHEYWHDIVLRDPTTRGLALDLVFDGSGVGRVTVLTGNIGLLGSTLEAGQSALLPPFVPLQIGGHAVAWGDPASARWSEAGGLMATGADGTGTPVAVPQEGLLAAPLALLGEGGMVVRRWLKGWRPVALLSVGLLIAAAPAAGPAVQRLRFGGDGVERLDTALAKAGLAPLEVRGDAASPGGLMVSGVVSRESDRVKAQDVLTSMGVSGTVDVQTTAALATAAADVARIHGVPASARPMARTAVELRTGALAPEARAKLASAVRSDVSGLTTLVIRDDLPAADDVPLRTIADATKKVSTVVAGDPAYIQTSDGSVYFAGAMMPTGHRLVSIVGHDVLLEKGGRQTRLTF